ncbi:MAG: von Willebrand factor type A domain-containing protein [Oscillospiraceae bacterium]|nr:von Willebrand factor type A domain-containing protein [Oscillospiraceae bacterium]
MRKQIISGVLSVIMALGTLPAIPASAAIDLKNLPTPIASDTKTVNKFTKTTPQLSTNDYTLKWKPVEGALYYEIYRKDEKTGKFEKYDTAFGTSYWSYNAGEFYIRAITYTYDDVKKHSRYSNTVKIKSYYDFDDYDEEYDDASVDAGIDYEASAGAGVEYDEDDISEEMDYDDGDVAYAPMPEPEEVDDDYNTEEYSKAEESGWKTAAISPLSTFSADVDTASYANLRRLIKNGDPIPTDAVRIEEMLNYFDYDYVVPKNNAFKINTELSDCPWNSDAQLLMVGIQGREIEKTPNSNLVFLIDTSGSMYSNDKLPLVKSSVKKLAGTMGKDDRISIVTYSGEERVIVAGANGNQIKMVSDLVSQLYANGSTNGESGINAAYALAEKYYIEGGNNRIIMATDGDLNVGISDEDELKKLIEKKRESGVYFSVLGYGTGNIKDNKMETLADNGNGSYHYIDTAKEAEKVLVAERDSTLFTIAEDVKLQVEFNPANVKSYRLIGYDNRRLANEDFKNDAKDAGEVGAGHSVTAIYEIIPADGKTGDSLKYQKSTANKDDIATVKVRYKNPASKKVSQISSVVDKASYSKEMSDNMKLAAAVTEFGLVLKNSEHKGTATAEGALKLAESISKPDYYEKEFISLIKKFMGRNKK